MTFFETWRLDPLTLIVIAIAAALYGAGVAILARRGEHWPILPTLGFYLLGLGGFAVVNLGFLGVYSMELRWAFTTRIALLLFAIPGLISLGLPITLAKRVLSGLPLRVTDAVLNSWPVRLFGNAVFAALFALGAFMVFLTPLAGSLRESPLAQALITVLVPAIGILMVLPIIEQTTQRTSFFITIEFLFVFTELVIDAIPGILLRLNNHILDQVGPVLGQLPAWFPSSYHDQHLSGDLLWFIAEVADIPVLFVLFIRWQRIDRKEAKKVDDLSDEEAHALTQAHLKARPQ
ncbi:MAG: cytochrome c oxidase assembly protein [Terrimesophilobacter sp.]